MRSGFSTLSPRPRKKLGPLRCAGPARRQQPCGEAGARAAGVRAADSVRVHLPEPPGPPPPAPFLPRLFSIRGTLSSPKPEPTPSPLRNPHYWLPQSPHLATRLDPRPPPGGGFSNPRCDSIWSAEPTTLTNYAWAAKNQSRRCLGWAPFAIREGACGLRKWCKLLVLKFDWSSA